MKNTCSPFSSPGSREPSYSDSPFSGRRNRPDASRPVQHCVPLPLRKLPFSGLSGQAEVASAPAQIIPELPAGRCRSPAQTPAQGDSRAEKSLPCPAGGPCPCTGTGVFFPRRDCFFRKNTAPCVFSGQRRNTSTPARAADGQDARNIRLCLQAGHAGAVSSVMPRLPAALKYRSPCRAPVLNSFPLFTGAKEAKLQLRHIALRRPYCPEDSAGQKMQVQERLRPCRTVLRRSPAFPKKKARSGRLYRLPGRNSP